MTASLAIVVALAFRDKQHLVEFCVPEGTTIRQAVLIAFRQELLPTSDSGATIMIDPATAPLGIYAEVEADTYILSDGDRVEIYRPLLQDPKEWRRQRARNAKNSS